jgi:hypothetical protein
MGEVPPQSLFVVGPVPIVAVAVWQDFDQVCVRRLANAGGFDDGPAPIRTHPDRHLVSWSTWCGWRQPLPHSLRSALRDRPSWRRSGSS